MESLCRSCGATVLDIDVRCKTCGASLGSTGAQRLIGQVVLGQYELVDVLGQGGMSVVYHGRHRITGQQVALKILPPELAAHAQVKSRFLEEARALAQLDHPNIVHLYNFGEENGSFVLAMQLVEGKTWERLILENQQLSWQVSARIAVDVLRALEYAHGRGVVHRDMKPSNVLIRSSDGAATVMDFGIAKMTTSSRLTATGQTMGTVRYMSPEQVRGQEVDASTDLYSLGATIYESITGDTPFEGSTHFDIMSKHLTEAPLPPSKHGVSLPRAFEQAIVRCLAKKPADRFASARELRKVIEGELRSHDGAIVETQKVSRDLLIDVTRTPSPAAAAPGTFTDLEIAPSPSRRRLGRWLIAAAMVAATAGALIGVALTRDRDEAPPPRWQPEGANLAQSMMFQDLSLTVRAPATLDANAVAEAYRAAWRAFQDHLQERGVHQAPRLPVQEIVVVPRTAFCAPSTYVGFSPPEQCASAVHAFRVADRTLVVVDDPAQWARAMRLGVPEAVCSAAADPQLCDLASQFVPEP